MFTVLRDEDSGICRTGKGNSATTGSQVSLLHPSMINSHWFTGTRNPNCSVFKPFIFCDNITPTSLTVSPDYGENDPAVVQPRFQKQVDRKHKLYSEHEKINPIPGDKVNSVVLDLLMKLENAAVNDVADICMSSSIEETDELGSLFKDSVYAEVKFYSKC